MNDRVDVDDGAADNTDEIIAMEAAGAVLARLQMQTERADHFERLLTAVVAKVGPVQLAPADYESADPTTLTLTRISDGEPGPTDPMQLAVTTGGH